MVTLGEEGGGGGGGGGGREGIHVPVLGGGGGTCVGRERHQ